MNKPYNSKERAEQLQGKASDAWQAVAELHNQTEMTEQDKKELRLIARKLAKIERRFLEQKLRLEKKENEQ